MPGAILITPEVLRLAEGYVQVKPLGPVPIKGWRGPLEVYEVTGAGPVRTRLQAAAARGLTRFVGRHTELATLRQAIEKALTGHGQVAAVIGEAGVGSPACSGSSPVPAHRLARARKPLGLLRQGHPVPARDRAVKGLFPDRRPR